MTSNENINKEMYQYYRNYLLSIRNEINLKKLDKDTSFIFQKIFENETLNSYKNAMEYNLKAITKNVLIYVYKDIISIKIRKILNFVFIN